MKNHLKVKQNYKKYLNGNQLKKNKYTQKKKMRHIHPYKYEIRKSYKYIKKREICLKLRFLIRF